jgi:2-keto-3-deoxygluconate permease
MGLPPRFCRPGLAAFPLRDLIGLILPLALGSILGNLSKTAREFLSVGEVLLIPFLGFVVGRSKTSAHL